MDIKTLIIIILTVIIIIAGVIIYKQIKSNKNKESFITMICTSGLSLMLVSSSNWLDKLLIGVGVITKYDEAIKLGGTFNWAYFIVGCILVTTSIFMYLFSKNKLYVLNINGYSSKKLESYLSKLKSNNSDFREREIDFIQIYKRVFSKKLDKTSYECIKSEIEEKVVAFKNETADIKKGYTGIAPIPFIMYAGTFLNRVKIDYYYEFDKIGINNYYVLSKKKKEYPKLKVTTNISQLDTSKDDLLLAISLTQKIEDNVLSQFVSTCNIVKIGVDTPTDNTIKYKDQLDDYINIIFDTIEKIKVIIPNVKIHLVYSGQSCLALEIGKRCFDGTRIPQIINYQFEAQNNIVKYPWGIVMNGSDKGKLIKV